MASFPHFGQLQPSGIPASQLLASSTKPTPGGLAVSMESPTRPTALQPAQPLSGAPQSPYSAATAAQYSSAATLLAGYTRLPGVAESLYGAASLAAAANPAQVPGGFYTLGADPAAFYVNPLTGAPYDIKENAEIWRNLSQPASCFPYDPSTLAGYPYGYGGMDFSLAARRKNATKKKKVPTATLR